MQVFGNHAANRGLARAHEADEREVGEMTTIVHGHELAENRGGRTPKSPARHIGSRLVS
jgi:hypothetical protein